LELGLKKAGVLSFLRDLDGNDEDPQCETLLKEASTQATGTELLWFYHIFDFNSY